MATSAKKGSAAYAAYVRNTSSAASKPSSSSSASTTAPSSTTSAAKPSSTTSVTSGASTSVPSGVTTKNASAQLRAGNITQSQYNSIMGTGGTTQTSPTTTPTQTTTQTSTKGKTISQSAYDNTVAAALKSGMTKADVDKQMASLGYTIGTPISTSTTVSQSPTQTKATNITTTPTQTKATNIVATPTTNITSPKTISQAKYDSIISEARKAGVSEDQINKSIEDMKKKGITISPSIETPEIKTDIKGSQKIYAPNGNEYDITVDDNGKASFISKADGSLRTFNSLQDAKNEINAKNPDLSGIGNRNIGGRIYDAQGKYLGKETDLNKKIPEALPEEDRLNIEETKSDIQGIDEIVQYAENMNDTNLQNALNAKNEVNQYINQLSQYSKETADALDSTIKQRFDSLNTSFGEIKNSINELETRANNLFDINKMIATTQRAKQLADAGILTSEQSASATGYALSNYTAQVELQRATLMQKAQENMVNALKEKQSMTDQILQQQGIDSVTKQNMVQTVNEMYQNMVNGYADRVNAANTAYDNAVQNAWNKQIEVDLQRKLPIIQEEAAKDLNATQKASANSDPQYRYDYVLNKFGEIDANLKSFVANIMGQYKNNGTFMSKDIDSFISELAKKAQASYKSYNSVSSSKSSTTQPSTTQPSTTQQQPNEQGNQNQNTNEVTESWTASPSMVGLSFGVQPQVKFNPISMSNTPMQSTIGGV